MSTADDLAATKHGNDGGKEAAAERDPVCGMTVDPATTQHRADYQGQPYYFCSARCCVLFIADPRRYLPPDQSLPEPATTHTAGQSVWTCPMHPQIVRSKPGSCPICGMALELLTPTGEEAHNPELRGMTRRFWVGVVVSIPLLAMAMADHFAVPAVGALTASRAAVWVQLVLGSAAVLCAAGRFSSAGGDRSSLAISTCSA
jgi:Cu+-exporting ATPase